MPGYVEASDKGRAAGRPQDRAKNAHGRGFSRAIRPEKAKDFPGMGVETDVIDCENLAAAQVAESLGQVFDMDHGAPQRFISH